MAGRTPGIFAVNNNHKGLSWRVWNAQKSEIRSQRQLKHSTPDRTAFSEPTLIKVASGFEAATQVRAHNLPKFLDTVPFHHIQGTKVTPPPQDTDTVNPADAKRMPRHM